MDLAGRPNPLCPAWCAEHQIDSVDGSVYHWSADAGTDVGLLAGAAEHNGELIELRGFIDGIDYTAQQLRTMVHELGELVAELDEG
jgi:hypothetical protein